MIGVPESGRALIADLRRDQHNLSVIIGLMVLGALVEGVGILLLVPLVSLLAEGGEWLASLPGGEWLLSREPFTRLAWVTGAFLCVMLLRAAITYGRDRTQARLVAGYERSLRTRTVRGLASMGWRKASEVGQAGMQRLLLAEAGRSATAVLYALRFATLALLLAGQGLIALFLSPTLTIVAAGAMVIVLLATRRWVRQSQQRGIAITTAFHESGEQGFRLHQGLKTALAEGHADRFLADYDRVGERLEREEIALERSRAIGRTTSTLIVAVAAVALLLVGRGVLELPAEILLPLLVVFARLAGPARGLVESYEGFTAQSHAFVPFRDFLSVPASFPPSPIEGKRLDLQMFEAHDVVVPAGDRFSVGPVSLRIDRGEWVGIAGPSGVGKTTLVDCIAGLLEPMSGDFRLDGASFAPAHDSRWAASLAYVGQRDMLFDLSLRHNLGLEGDPGAEDRAILDATGVSALADSWPGGFDTRVGDRGIAVSGGEAQRIALARALLRRPALLILDEATAALSVRAEADVFGKLSELVGPAILMVAHRPESLRLMARTIDLGSEKMD